MLTSEGQVKITDFGLAASLTGRSRLTKSGITLGTPAYTAPEQLEARDVDRRADILALGCVLYETLTQRTPFEAAYEQVIAYGILNEEPEPVTAQRGGLPVEIDQVISKTLAKGRGGPLPTGFLMMTTAVNQSPRTISTSLACDCSTDKLAVSLAACPCEKSLPTISLPAFNHSTYRLALQSHCGSAFLVGSVDCARRHFDRVGPSESRDY